MSIVAYTGLPGSGKSYDVVANQIMPALKAGRRVCTNIPLHLDAVREVTRDGEVVELPLEAVKAQPERIFEYCTPGTVLVMDELWQLFPAGLKTDRVPDPYKKLLAEHRHMVDERGNATQIVFVTQDLAQISAFARQLVEQTFIHTKLSHIAGDASYRIDVYNGPRTGQPPKDARVREIFGRYDKAIFPLYQSHTQSKAAGPGANEKGADRRGTFWRRPMLWVGLVGTLAVLAWAIPTVGHYFRGDGLAGPVAASAATGDGPPERRPTIRDRTAAAVVAPSRVSASTQPWRVVAYVIREGGKGSVALISDGDQQVTLPFERACRMRSTDRLVECEFEGETVREYRAF